MGGKSVFSPIKNTVRLPLPLAGAAMTSGSLVWKAENKPPEGPFWFRYPECTK
jgi:hypothetical protein